MIPIAVFVASWRPTPTATAPRPVAAPVAAVAAPELDPELAVGVTRINPVMTVYVSVGLPAAAVADVSAAVTEINRYSGARWTVARGDGRVSPNEVQVQYGSTARCDNVGPDWGCTIAVNRDGARIYAEVNLASTIPAGSLAWVLYHELGHVVGVEHSRFGVMRPGAWTWTTYQPSDIAALERLR